MQQHPTYLRCMSADLDRTSLWLFALTVGSMSSCWSLYYSWSHVDFTFTTKVPIGWSEVHLSVRRISQIVTRHP